MPNHRLNLKYRHLTVSPGRDNTLVSESGEILTPPDGWTFLPAGDAGITRRVKAKGPTWAVQVVRGRRKISQGVWADAAHIRDAQAEVTARRSEPAYRRQMEQARRRRMAEQAAYEQTFHNQVLRFLDFHRRYADLAESMALHITSHAAPVGSGTVARTRRIPVEERAEAAVIAWLRHHTTAYDTMKIPRVRGGRRAVRRRLAKASVTLIAAYREGRDVDEHCPLKQALQ